MDNLLCDEVFPNATTPDHHSKTHHDKNVEESCVASLYCMTKAECEQSISICLDKELSYMPELGYINHLGSQSLVSARLRAIQWLIKSLVRLNLSLETVFCAANYLDRFISINQHLEWKEWMVELLSVACLSVASKSNETNTPLLLEIQMEGLDHSYQSITIQKMELILLKSLQWRLVATTPFSFVELMVNIVDCHDSLNAINQKKLVARITHLLPATMLDCALMEFRPSVVAASALWCSLDELFPLTWDEHLSCVTKFFPVNRKEDITKCYKIMGAKLNGPSYSWVCYGKSLCHPSSPVTVLLTERNEINDRHLDLSLFEISMETNSSNKSNKRRRTI